MRSAARYGRSAARYGYQILVDIWNGMRNGLDQIGPAGILAATVVVLLLLYLAR